jgi:glyoxylase I family protein
MTVSLTPINVATTGVHHVSLRCTDLARSRVFYVDRLGFVPLLDTPELLIVAAGQTAFAIRAPGATTAPGDAFDPLRGYRRVAPGCHGADRVGDRNHGRQDR